MDGSLESLLNLYQFLRHQVRQKNVRRRDAQDILRQTRDAFVALFERLREIRASFRDDRERQVRLRLDEGETTCCEARELLFGGLEFPLGRQVERSEKLVACARNEIERRVDEERWSKRKSSCVLVLSLERERVASSYRGAERRW